MIKHRKIYIGIILMAMLVASIMISRRELFNEFFSTVKLQYLSNYLSNNYLYAFDENKGLEAVYSGYLSGVENNVTFYLDEGDFCQAKIEDAGNYFGTGIAMMWSMDGQSFTVTDVIPGSPAEQEGITAGDKITKINDTQVLMSNSQTLLHEAFSTKPEAIHYFLSKENEEKEVSLVPAEVSLTDLEEEMMGDILYIKLNEIQTGTSNKLSEMIEKAAKDNCKGVILDIRDLYTNNINEIDKICDLFLEDGTAFKVKSKQDHMTAYMMKEGAVDKALCLITNSSTRAGAEALVLGLKDRAQIVGSDTAGLSYLRTLVSLEDGSGMSVASGVIVDKYGNELSADGIEPDERVYISQEEKVEIVEKGKVTRANDSFIKAAIASF